MGPSRRRAGAVVKTLHAIGFGYCAEALAHLLAPRGWRISGTSRTVQGAAGITAKGFAGHVFDGTAGAPEAGAALAKASHLLVSAPPERAGDPVLRAGGASMRQAQGLAWIGYLSTIGVYGDAQGEWVDEDTPPRGRQDRAIRRIEAEQAWLAFGAETGRNVQIFRLAGIYGPGRNILLNLRDGTARRIVKPGQVFNRIHVADIAQALAAAMARGQPGRIYNLTDDEPAAPDAVLVHGARLLGMAAPAPVPFDAATLSPMAASFYDGSRRVRNHRLKHELAVELHYPTFREGLRALAAELVPPVAAAGEGAGP